MVLVLFLSEPSTHGDKFVLPSGTTKQLMSCVRQRSSQEVWLLSITSLPQFLYWCLSTIALGMKVISPSVKEILVYVTVHQWQGPFVITVLVRMINFMVELLYICQITILLQNIKKQ